MIDLGFTIVPLDVISWMAITTACLLAIMYIGFEVISAVGGIIMAVVALRRLVDEEPLVIMDYSVGPFGATFILIAGVYLAYRGATGFLNASKP